MFRNRRRIDVILKGSLFIIWIATVSTSALTTNNSADSLSHKTVSLTQTLVTLANASGKIPPNITDNNNNNNKSVSTKRLTTKSSRFLDDYGELPGIPKDDDDYDTFVNATVKTTTVRIPTQEKEEVNAFLSGARPSVDGNRNRAGETEGDTVANKTSSEVLKTPPSNETGSVENRTSSSSNPGKNSTTKTGSVKQVAAGETNSTKLPASKDLKPPKDQEKLSKVPNDKDKHLSTTNKTATVKTPVHQKVEANASLPGAHPPIENKQQPTVKNNGTKINTVPGASKTNVSHHAGGLNTSKTLSTTPNVTGNETKPLNKVTVTSKVKVNSTSKTSKPNSTSSVSKDNASDAKTLPSRNITTAGNHTATKHIIKDVALKTGVSNSASVKTNDSRKIIASIQSGKPSVAATNAKSIGNITNTKNQTSKAIKFESVLKIGKSNTTHGTSKGKAGASDNVKPKNQPAPTSNTADAGGNKKANNQTSEISKINKTLKADKSVTTFNVTKAKTSSAGSVKSNKTLTTTSNSTGTNDTNKAKNNISASLKSKNTQTLNKTNPVSIVSKIKENNIGKLNNKSTTNTTGSGNTTKTNNKTSATLTFKSVLKIGESNSKTSVKEDKGSNAGNLKKQPAATSKVNGTGSSSKSDNRTSATSKIEAALKASKSNTPSNVTKEKNVDSVKGNKPPVKTSNTTVAGNTSKTKDHTSAAESIKASSKGGKLNATLNALKDKDKTLGNTKKEQSVVNLKMTATGNNVSKTNNQTSATLKFKSIFKIIDKSNTTSDLTKDKGNSSGKEKTNNSVKSDKISPATSSVKDKINTTKTHNQTSETLIFKRNVTKADR